MNFVRKIIFIVFLCLIVLSRFHHFPIIVNAETLDNTVSDYLENKEENSEEHEPKEKPASENLVQQQNKEIGIGPFEVIKMLAALVFVVLLLYFLLKFMNKKSRSYQQNKLVQNFGGTSLGGNRSVQVIKIGKQVLILGVGEDIRLLKEITDEDELQYYIRQYEEQLDQSLQPSDLITKWWKANQQKNKRKNDQHVDKSFHAHLKEKLDEIKKDRKKAINHLEEKEHRSDE